MTAPETTEAYYDPYDAEINADPYPVFRRLREEAPLHYNERHDFHAVSRYEDVERGVTDHEAFISGRGAILELIRAGIEIPPGVLLFEDETGTRRRLTREEILTYVTVIAGAGNETTTRLIGWTGKVLADHPDQRRTLAEDHALIPDAIEEPLRYEAPAPHVARYVARDVEVHGRVVPAGSVMMFLLGSANRDDRRYTDGDRFDIHRKVGSLLAFGRGIHFCLGAALARLEGRIALEEVLKRFPEWEVDLAGAELASTSTVRGWNSLPVHVG
ncbi:cytochrome P450 [Spirillospora sp. CA-255316]